MVSFRHRSASPASTSVSVLLMLIFCRHAIWSERIQTVYKSHRKVEDKSVVNMEWRNLNKLYVNWIARWKVRVRWSNVLFTVPWRKKEKKISGAMSAYPGLKSPLPYSQVLLHKAWSRHISLGISVGSGARGQGTRGATTQARLPK